MPNHITEPSLRVRWRVRWHREALTEELAAGVDPGECAELALLAGRLASARTRERLARGIDRLLRLAVAPPGPTSPVVPLNRPVIMALRDQLAGLAERLRNPAVPVETVALVAALLQDGTGPLYASVPREGDHAPLLQRLAAQPAFSGGPGRRFRRPR
jgi:hypothetical protein